MTEAKLTTPIIKLNVKRSRDAYIIVKGTITVPNTGTVANLNNRKSIIIKDSAPFTNWINEINNTQIDNAKDINVVMPMLNLIEDSDNCSKTSGSLC